MTQEENCSHYRDMLDKKKSKTSGRTGTLYENGTEVARFRSLQQAKIYVKEHFGCSLSTIGEMNINKKHGLIFMRNDINMSPSDYIQMQSEKQKEVKSATAKRNKDNLGFKCTAYHKGEKLGTFSSIRDANNSIHHDFKKVSENVYKVFDYDLVIE